MMASRLFWYWNTRYLMGSVGEDCGAEIRDALKVLAKTGVCHEEQWPYKRARFAMKPTAVCYEEATPHRALRYYRVPRSLAMLRAALARHMAVMFGMTLYDSFEGDDATKTGRVPMPGPDEAPIGGHAMLLVGYDDHQQTFLVRNSWGTGWGDPQVPGHCHVPYALVLGRGSAADFWVLEQVTG
jgi:C1A family cysteine protease